MQNNKLLHFIKIFLFFAMLGIIGIFSLVLTRPTESATENRKLAEFPKFSLSSLFNGSFASGIDKWYSDTMPNRDNFINLNNKLWSIKGITIGGEVQGSVVQGDEIPDAPWKPDISQPDNNDTGNNETTSPTEKEEEPIDPNDKGEVINALYVYKNSAHSYYSFVESTSQKYVTAVETAAVKLKGYANVYDIIVPLSTDIVLKDSVRAGLNTSDQKSAIKYMYSGFTEAKTVDIFETLRAHRDEYLYFRTDHHWTALAAYYTYTEWAEAKGITPNSLDSYETVTFDGFLGTLYAKTNKSQALADTPDEVIAYYPMGTNSITITQNNGELLYWNIITDVSSWVSSSKYNTFIGGDNPFSVIKNPTITDGSSCVVIKESFGNAFVPFLVDHYQYVYVIDYRYYKGSLTDFVKQNNVQDVIFINNISATSTSARVNELTNLVNR